VAGLLAQVSGLSALPAWVSAEARGALGGRAAGAIVALAGGQDPAGARDALAGVAWEIGLARRTEAMDAGAQEVKVQRALASLLALAPSQDRSARLKNFSRVLALVAATRELPDEKTLVRQVRPAYRVLRATLIGTRARLLLALPDVIDKALAMTDPGLVAAVNAHRETLDEARLLVSVSRVIADPGAAPGSEPPTSDRWRHIADQLLRLGQEMGRPQTRSRAMETHHAVLLEIERFARLPGEDELAAVARGLSGGGLHADAWRSLTGGKATELSARVGMARSRWVVGLGGKGNAADADLAAMDDLVGLMTVLDALAALDIGADGRPGAGYGVLQAWAGWELSAEAVESLAAPVAREAAGLVAAEIAGDSPDLSARIAVLRDGAGVLRAAGGLSRAAVAEGLSPGSVLRECAIGGPPPRAWLGADLERVAGMCRYSEEAAAARRLGDSGRAAALEAYAATLMDGLNLPPPGETVPPAEGAPAP
jgi:hypothetical protein